MVVIFGKMIAGSVDEPVNRISFQKMIENDESIDLKKFGLKLFLFAVKDEFEEGVTFLIEKGLMTHHTENSHGSSLLHCAIKSASPNLAIIQMVKNALIQVGYKKIGQRKDKAFSRTPVSKSPIMIAQEKGVLTVEFIDFAKEYGVDFARVSNGILEGLIEVEKESHYYEKKTIDKSVFNKLVDLMEVINNPEPIIEYVCKRGDPEFIKVVLEKLSLSKEEIAKTAEFREYKSKCKETLLKTVPDTFDKESFGNQFNKMCKYVSPTLWGDITVSPEGKPQIEEKVKFQILGGETEESTLVIYVDLSKGAGKKVRVKLKPEESETSQDKRVVALSEKMEIEKKDHIKVEVALVEEKLESNILHKDKELGVDKNTAEQKAIKQLWNGTKKSRNYNKVRALFELKYASEPEPKYSDGGGAAGGGGSADRSHPTKKKGFDSGSSTA